MFGIEKLKKQMKEEIWRAEEARKFFEKNNEELKKQLDAVKNFNEKLEFNNNELNKQVKEISGKVSVLRIKDVLRSFEYNQIKPDRIFLNKDEFEILKNYPDVVKVENKGTAIYGIRMVVKQFNHEFVISKQNFSKDLNKMKRG